MPDSPQPLTRESYASYLNSILLDPGKAVSAIGDATAALGRINNQQIQTSIDYLASVRADLRSGASLAINQASRQLAAADNFRSLADALENRLSGLPARLESTAASFVDKARPLVNDALAKLADARQAADLIRSGNFIQENVNSIARGTGALINARQFFVAVKSSFFKCNEFLRPAI